MSRKGYDSAHVARLEADLEQLRNREADSEPESRARYERWRAKKHELDTYKASFLPAVPPGGPPCSDADCSEPAAYSVLWFDGSGGPKCGYHTIATLYSLGSSATPLFRGFPRDPRSPLANRVRVSAASSPGRAMVGVASVVVGLVLGGALSTAYFVLFSDAALCGVPVLERVACAGQAAAQFRNRPSGTIGPVLNLWEVLGMIGVTVFIIGALYRRWAGDR